MHILLKTYLFFKYNECGDIMKFRAFNLDQKLLNSLKELGYEDCTPVQEKVIPLALRRKNLFVQSETGSGKTHSFFGSTNR